MTTRHDAGWLCRVLVCVAWVALATGAWAAEWAYDDLLTLSLEVGNAQTPQGPVAQLTASASLPRELVEQWTDEALKAPVAAGSPPAARGYRVRIAVQQSGKPVTTARVVPGTGPLGDWLGVIPCEVLDRVIWKRRAATKVTVTQPLGKPPATYTVVWIVNCHVARVETAGLPAPGGAKAPATPPEAEPTEPGRKGLKDVAVVAAPPTGETAPGASAGVTGLIASAVLCRGVGPKNEPIQPGDHFAGDTQLITLLVEHRFPEGVSGEVRVALSREGEKKSGHVVEVDGAGKFVIEYQPGPSGRFRPGEWQVRIEVAGQLDRELRFTVAE